MGKATDGDDTRGGRRPAVPPLLPVCDTVSGRKAAADPDGTVRHYERLAEHLWIPRALQEMADGLFEHVRGGRTRWASVSGPYGYGKTAAGVSVWRHAAAAGFTAVPPLSCSNFDEFAHAVAAVAGAGSPKHRARIDRLLEKVWGQGLDAAVKADVARYELPGRTVRRLLQDKLRAGQLSLDGQCHRLVEFLSELGRLVSGWSQGLVVVLDELQQLLGPLDTRAITQFREFVWGMRTEQSPCGVVVCFDAMLEARLARWAADLLHRVRESGPSLQMAEVYTRDFPVWLWGQCTTPNGSPAKFAAGLVTPAVLASLGQFVERPDLANGPRTVVDVFCRAAAHHAATRTPYDVGDLVADVETGRLRYFGEGAPVQRALAELLRDDWLRADPDRLTLVRTLAAFPRGCPEAIASAAVGVGRLAAVRKELFGPLLVSLPEGLALERLQQVRRVSTDWERVLSRCWETLPAQDALLEHAPDMVWRVVVSRLFPAAQGSTEHWERTSDEGTAALTGWRHLRGSFDDDFPQRDIAVWVGTGNPAHWPNDADVAFAFSCTGDPAATPVTTLIHDADGTRVTISLPVLRPIDGFVPAELDRYRKYIQPEPFRGLPVVAALHELEVTAGPDEADAPAALRSFLGVVTSFITGELVQGAIAAGPKLTVRQRGAELVRALFSAACRARYPLYRTISAPHKWRELIDSYRKALRTPDLDDTQRRGETAATGAKAEVLRRLFGQSSAAAGDSLLRVLGPLVEAGGTANAFSVRFTAHPGEKLAREYLQKTARKRPVVRAAVQEALRHAGYLPAETDALLDVLCERGVLAESVTGLRVASQDPTGLADVARDIEVLAAQLRALGVSDIPPRPKSQSAKGLLEHADALRELVADTVQAAIDPVQSRVQRMRESLGLVQAEVPPDNWVKSGITAHLRGIAKLLGRTRDDILRALRRETDRAEKEVIKATNDGTKWAAAWRKRGPGFEAIWDELARRVEEFVGQALALRTWAPLNARLTAVVAMGDRLAATEPALDLSARQLVEKLRTAFATNGWEPLQAYEETERKVSEIEQRAHTLSFSGMRAYHAELETLRTRFGRMLDGEPPAVDGNPPFALLYSWVAGCFESAWLRLSGRRGRGETWRHPDAKSHRWADMEGQIGRALTALRPTPALNALVRLGELLNTLRLGFLAAAADRGEMLFDHPDSSQDVGDLTELLARGAVRVRVEWVAPATE